MVILGVDPGYAIVGYGVVHYERSKFTPVRFGAITTPAGMAFEDRLHIIYDDMGQVIAKAKPDACLLYTSRLLHFL